MIPGMTISETVSRKSRGVACKRDNTFASGKNFLQIPKILTPHDIHRKLRTYPVFSPGMGSIPYPPVIRRLRWRSSVEGRGEGELKIAYLLSKNWVPLHVAYASSPQGCADLCPKHPGIGTRYEDVP